jgi:hypothetical protein
MIYDQLAETMSQLANATNPIDEFYKPQGGLWKQFNAEFAKAGTGG